MNTADGRTTRFNQRGRSDVRGRLSTFLTTSDLPTAEGTTYTAKIRDREDLNRQIVRSSNCEIVIPEVDLTLPPTERGQLTTIEGLLRDIIADLSGDQPLRKIQDEATYTKVDALLTKLWAMLGDSPDADEEDDSAPGSSEKKELLVQPFTLKLDDPSGNSFLEFLGSMSDPKWTMRTYPRTLEQNVQLGLVAPPEEKGEDEVQQTTDEITKDEVFTFPGTCSRCGHPINTNMKRVDIPYFKVCRIESQSVILSSDLLNRKSSSCRRIATIADTEITKSSRELQSLNRESVSF